MIPEQSNQRVEAHGPRHIHMIDPAVLSTARQDSRNGRDSAVRARLLPARGVASVP